MSEQYFALDKQTFEQMMAYVSRQPWHEVQALMPQLMKAKPVALEQPKPLPVESPPTFPVDPPTDQPVATNGSGG